MLVLSSSKVSAYSGELLTRYSGTEAVEKRIPELHFSQKDPLIAKRLVCVPTSFLCQFVDQSVVFHAG
jgi:hypothetical protein